MAYICTNCEYQTLRWEGKCPQCSEWGTIEENLLQSSVGKKGGSTNSSIKGSIQSSSYAPAHSQKIGEFKDRSTSADKRLSSGFSEFDRVLGGGFVPGEVVLLSGDPGIGKSTILLQIAVGLANSLKILYVSGEESPKQLYTRLNRICEGKPSKTILDNFYITSDVQVEGVYQLIEEMKPDLVIVDSIQSMISADVKSYAGSITQVRVCGQLLTRCAKENGIPIVIVGQINKEGAIAGPKVLEHAVDCVLYMEGDEYNVFRILRSIKNRFGATSEIGIFEMVEGGVREVKNPSEVFIQESENVAGSCISAIVKGSRVVFIEVQALAIERESVGGPLRRVANGFKKPRLDMLTAVLSKRGNLFLGDKDVFVNIVGGMNVDSPSIDLAVCAAIKSAVTDVPYGKDVVFVGEVGLTGGVRGFYGVESVVKEVFRLGYKKVWLPQINLKVPKGAEVQMLRSISKV